VTNKGHRQDDRLRPVFLHLKFGKRCGNKCLDVSLDYSKSRFNLDPALTRKILGIKKALQIYARL